MLETLFSSLIKVTNFKVFWVASPPYLPIVFGTNRKFTESVNLMCSMKKLFWKIWHNSLTIAEKICSAKYRNQAKSDRSRSSPRRCSVKMNFSEILQNPQENICGKVSFWIKLQAWGLQLYLKKRIWHRCFSANFTKFLRTTFLTEHIRWLLLKIWHLL